MGRLITSDVMPLQFAVKVIMSKDFIAHSFPNSTSVIRAWFALVRLESLYLNSGTSGFEGSLHRFFLSEFVCGGLKPGIIVL